MQYILTISERVVVALVLVFLLGCDRASIDYDKYKKIEKDWSLQMVTELLGPGTMIIPSKLPTRQSVERRDGAPFEPVVRGDAIYVWDQRNHKIYVGFDKDKKVVSKFFLDHNSL